MPECRICHMPIDKANKECYDTWKAAPATDDDWVSMIYDFLARDLKVSYDWHMCQQQIENFWKKKKINPKGIYFTLKYFYQIKGNSWEKGHGGIGIVPYVFDDAKAYWIAQEQKKQGFIKQVESEAKERTIIKITRSERKRDKYNLDEIGGEE